MELGTQIDLYCERIGPEFWAESINAITNSAFLMAAIWAEMRLWGSGLWLGWILAALLFAIGTGSFLFHTFATGWAAVLDVIPIAFFILSFVFATHLHVLGWSLLGAALGTLAFLPYMFAAATGFNALPFFQVSGSYWPLVLALLLYALALMRPFPSLARGFVIGAGILTVSLTFRSIDIPLCDGFPHGTHFMWHILNGVMLAWMIEVYRRHLLAARVT